MSNRGNIGQRGGRGRGGDNRGAQGRGRGRGSTNTPAAGGGGSQARGGSSAFVETGRGGGRGESSFEGRGRGGDGRGRGGFETRGGTFRGGGGPRGGGFRGRGGPIGPIIFAENAPARIDSRLKTTDQLITSFKKLTVRNELPPRPGFGTLGAPITLRANFFPVRVPKGPIYDYKVEITPKTDINRLKARIFVLLEQNPLCAQHLNYITHDNSERLISAKELPQPLDIQVPFYDDGESGPRPGAKIYNVSINFSRQLDTSHLTKYLDGQSESRDYDPLPLMSALNLVLQRHASRNGVRVGQNRYFFPSTSERFDIGLGLDACRGYFASVRPTYKQLMVNVNVCMTAFYVPGNLADAIMAFNQRSKGGMPSKFAEKIKVTTSHLGYKRKKPIFAITSKSADKTFFNCQELGGNISVEQYFKRKYNIKLKYAKELPVVNIGNRDKPNLVPAELCEIEAGQPYRGRLGDQETANMIKYACNPPRVNAELIVQHGLPTLGLNPPNLATPLDGFGVTIDNEMAVIPARELPPPKLSYRVGVPNVRDGSWNILDVKFQRGANVASWWVLVVDDGRPAFENKDDPRLVGLTQGFAAKCTRSGMTMPGAGPQAFIATTRLPLLAQDPSRTGAIDMIRQAIKRKLAQTKKPSFILVLLSGQDNYIYPGIKRIGEVELGIHTVHMLLSKVLKPDTKKQDQYFSNVALKVNTKLGGINHLLAEDSMKWLKTKTTIVVGMDVTHPGPTSIEGTPSVAAVVASVDDSFVQFPASMRIQKSKKEMITELRDMMVERLLTYEKKNRRLPERIFVYRDGVSEGQFNTVLEEELPCILESFKKFNTKDRKLPYKPKLSIIICGKRHHARFYATGSANADKNGNTRPGTVVDKGVTAVFEFDFYLQAHAGLQGTVKPTHYTVVYDENKLGADEIQQGTNTSSYLYARATKAVSLVPAAYYADLACERGRCYINDFLNTGDDKSSAGTGRKKQDRDEEKARVFNAAKDMWGEGVHVDLRDSMFYI